MTSILHVQYYLCIKFETLSQNAIWININCLNQYYGHRPKYDVEFSIVPSVASTAGVKCKCILDNL